MTEGPFLAICSWAKSDAAHSNITIARVFLRLDLLIVTRLFLSHFALTQDFLDIAFDLAATLQT